MLVPALHPGSNAPTVAGALRRLVANALDARPDRRRTHEGAPVLSFEAPEGSATGTVRLFNPGATLPRSALLVGWSGPPRRDRSRSRRGEGLPTALLGLAHRGCPVRVRTGTESWRPVLRHDDALGAEVLAIEVEPDEHPGVEVIVERVPADDWAWARDLFLELDPTFDPEQTVNASKRERVLLQPEHRGRVYARGELHFTDDTMAFGYDLDLEIDPDEVLEDSTLEYVCAQALRRGLVRDGARLLPRVERALFDEPHRAEARWNWDVLAREDALGRFLADRFHARYGANALPVADLAEVDRAEFVGRNGVVVGPLALAVLERTVGSLADLVEGRGNGSGATRVWRLAELSDDERAVLTECIGLVRGACPAWRRDVEVVDFATPGLSGTFDTTTRRVALARRLLARRKDTLVTLVHEVAHLLGLDGTRTHQDYQVELLARIVDGLLTPDTLRVAL